MKKFEIKAYSYDEAKQKALDLGMTIVRNVTPTFKNENPVNFDEFAQSMLEKNKLANATGVGCVVVAEAGSADTRERPYEFVNNVTTGQLTKKRVFEIRTAADNTLVATADTKVAAARLAKAAMKTAKQDLVCKQVYKVDSDHELAFSLKYVPSSNTKLGTYIVFGNC